MRILILSQFYDPEPISKPAALARALVRRGHEVSVLTGFPNYPSGRLYPGFRLRLVSKEEQSGIRVVRAYTLPSRRSSLFGRFLNYASFMVSSVIASFWTPRCDVIYVWHPPLTIGLSATVIGLLKRAPFVYDVQDIWPESVVWSGMLTNRLAVWLMHRLESFIYRRAKHILVVTEGAKKNLLGKGIPADKITVARHLVDEGLFSDKAEDGGAEIRRKYGLGDRFVVMFAGNIGLVQGLDTVMRCAGLLRGHPGIVFVFVGDGIARPYLMSQVRDLALTNVVFVDRQPMTMMPAFFASADALLVHLRRSKLSEIAIPVKTLTYLAAGRPILMAVNGAAADLIAQSEAGIVIPPDNPAALGEAVLRLARLPVVEREAMGRSGRDFLTKEFARDKVLDHYEAIFSKACDNVNGRPAGLPHGA